MKSITVTCGALALCAELILGPAAGFAETPPSRQNMSRAGRHAGHDTTQEKQKPVPPHDHRAPRPKEEKEYPEGIRPITDEDRKAAFPDVDGHTVHDRAIHYFVLFDQFEWQDGDGRNAFNWDNKGWIGGDLNRFWFRTEAKADEEDFVDAQAHVLYGRAIHRWWDVVGGIRQDMRPGPARTWAALGIQGLAPYRFELEATAYLGESGRTHFRFETEYELLLTNRLILQPLVELEIYGKDDLERGIGAGISSLETGLRLRYELRRELAPYVGVSWDRKFFGTADLARSAGEEVSGARLVLGARLWF